MRELTSKERKTLSKIAHNMKPVMHIGQNGLTDGIVKKAEESLAAHELIKIKFVDYKGEKIEFSNTICTRCSATLVRIIGNIAILYRPSKKEEDRKYGIVL